jgi:hypothetical protein
MHDYPWIENSFILRRLKHELLIPIHWARFMLQPRRDRDAMVGHASRVVESPDFALIPKHPNAGRVRNRRLIMHNGLKVLPTAYYGYQFLARSRKTLTVDEPQEERLFGDLLRHLPPRSTMLELGSFWAFYSLWFHSAVPHARNYMVEPVLKNLAYGKTNFEINGFTENATFVHALVDAAPGMSDGIPVISVDSFCREHAIDHLTVLHSDIQGYESRMLDGAEEMLSKGGIDYIFISSHSNVLHDDCIATLKRHGYGIVSDVNLDEAYQADGVIFAARQGMPTLPIVPATKRPPQAG